MNQGPDVEKTNESRLSVSLHLDGTLTVGAGESVVVEPQSVY